MTSLFVRPFSFEFHPILAQLRSQRSTIVIVVVVVVVPVLVPPLSPARARSRLSLVSHIGDPVQTRRWA